nr:MAG: putative RNA-dependent RNA polymerase [Totiviridae sp.]
MRRCGADGLPVRLAQVKSVPHTCTGDGMVEFSEKDQTLWKLGKVHWKLPVRWRRLGAKWGECLYKYSKHIPTDSQVLLTSLITCAPVCCESGLIAWLKEIGRLCTAASVHIGHGSWIYLCDIHVLGGYDTFLNRVDVLEECKILTEPKVSGASKYASLLLDGIRDTVSKIAVDRQRTVGLQDFIHFRDNWTIPGACSIGSSALLEVRRRGGWKRVRASGKLGKTVEMSDVEIVKAARAREPAVVRPFRKVDEPVKTRAVYAYDTRSYLRCSWLSSFLGDYNAYGTWTPLGTGRRTRATQRLDIAANLGSSRRAVSLDQSSFDLNQPKWLVKAAMREVISHILRYTHPSMKDELAEIAQTELHSFEEAYMPGVGRWRRGVPSGHKWTALLDSILNRAECLVAARIRRVKIVQGWWQGDDGLVFEEGEPVMGWAEAYSELGLSVNADKTWVDGNSCEFLHEFYTQRAVRAFPARSFRSVLWSKPIMGTSSFQTGLDYVQSSLDTWLKCARRGLVNMDKMAVSLLMRRGLTYSKALGVLRTPRAFGGLGWAADGRLGLRWSGGKVWYRRVRLVSKPAFGYGRLGQLAILNRLGATMPLPTTPLQAVSFPVRGFCDMPPPRNLGLHPRLKFQWCDEDPVEDPWYCRIYLEAMLACRAPWLNSMVPCPFIRSLECNVEKAFRLINRWGSRRLGLDTLSSTGEAWASVADSVNREWAGFVTWVAAVSNSHWKTKLGAVWLGLAREALASLRYFDVLYICV